MSEEKSKEVSQKTENVFLSPECPVKKVTVYSDRAEVCRQIDTSLVKGVNEVVLKKLPASIDSDSIRVEGTGEATIAEVSFQNKIVTADDADLSSQEKALEDQLKDLNKEKEQLVAKQTILTKQWKLLDNFGETVSKSSKEKGPDLDKAFLQGVGDFLVMFKDEGSKLETSRLELEAQLETLNEKINTINQNLSKLRGNRHNITESRECTIVLESEGDSKVSLLVSYVVLQAFWTPSYDIRMFTAECMLKITYYGQITQRTGEDWTDAKLFLSTAMPSVGGTVPELPVVTLSIRQYFAYQRSKNRESSFRSLVPRKASNSVLSSSSLAHAFRDESLDILQERCAEQMSFTEMKVTGSRTSASYEISRLSTIPSDNLPHKVSVGIFDIKPTLEYVTIPKVAPRAFLRAKVVNSSVFTLLPGPTSIFLDNSFVAKAEMKSVSPGEEFTCSLGVDPAVRVTYKPLKKFTESIGFINKSTSIKHEQAMEIKNTHDYPIKIELKDQLPRSSDEKIKVTLQDPLLDMKHPEKNTNPYLDKHNHVIWDLEVDKQETREITLKYTVEHPTSENIVTIECFEGDN